MKKIIVLGGVLFFMASCGGGTTVCDCYNALGEMMEDYQAADMDQAKMDELEKKYEKINQDCESLANELGDEEFEKAMKDC